MLVRLKVDVIFTHGTPATILAKQTTLLIPIVFTVVGDPVGTGIVANLARPGGNVTGQSSLTPDLAAKRLELLRDVVPRLRSLARPKSRSAAVRRVLFLRSTGGTGQ